MSMKNVRDCLWIAGVLLAVVPAVRAQEPGGMPMTLDEEYARLAEEIPGFGGLYLDTVGTTHVYLQDLSRERDVQDLGDRVVVEQGDYDFRDLVAWKEELGPQLSQKGAVFLDIDERVNRIVLGVERDSLATFAAELEKFLQETRVPPEAVLVEAAEPVVAAMSLTDSFRPVPGGVQVQSAGGTCTLGINATRQGVRGFVINSHCTITRGGVEGTVFSQSTVIGALNRIGVETVDPPYFTGGSCPPNRRCRASDAAFAAYDSSSFSAGGKLANPAFCMFGAGTTTISSQTPRRPVTGFLFGSPASGSVVTKIGRTTGCTLGATLSTCASVNVLLSDITMLCQNRVAGLAGPGDSGSPVFLDPGDGATLTGILWGITLGTETYVYSPWLWVFAEISGVLMPDAP
jgi:hypothetical protein